MAFRSLTDIFVLMRNNALRNRHIFAEQEDSEHMALVELGDVEQGSAVNYRMPPPWIDHLDEAHYTSRKLKTRIEDLIKLHSVHLHRPTFDDSSEGEAQIEKCTGDITTLFNNTHRIIQVIKAHTKEGSQKERLLTTNVMRSLATSLQDLSIQFRGSQNSYIKQLQSREERSRIYFEDPVIQDDYDMLASGDMDDFFVNSSRQMTQQQLLYLEEENIQEAQQREQEINSVVRSIVELNQIFKDLGQMVLDQGSVLDRIDYNVEKAHTQVYQGYKQLEKAHAYQTRHRKMWAIITLAATSILLLFILIVVKS